MSRFRNQHTNIVVSVDDSKDHRYQAVDGWTLESADSENDNTAKAPAKKTASKAQS